MSLSTVHLYCDAVYGCLYLVYTVCIYKFLANTILVKPYNFITSYHPESFVVFHEATQTSPVNLKNILFAFSLVNVIFSLLRFLFTLWKKEKVGNCDDGKKTQTFYAEWIENMLSNTLLNILLYFFCGGLLQTFMNQIILVSVFTELLGFEIAQNSIRTWKFVGPLCYFGFKTALTYACFVPALSIQTQTMSYQAIIFVTTYLYSLVYGALIFTSRFGGGQNISEFLVVARKTVLFAFRTSSIFQIWALTILVLPSQPDQQIKPSEVLFLGTALPASLCFIGLFVLFPDDLISGPKKTDSQIRVNHEEYDFSKKQAQVPKQTKAKKSKVYSVSFSV